MKPRPKGPRADARTSITSVARRSAKEELEADEDEDASEAKILANEADAEKLANRVVELILAGMTYTQALGHVRQLNDNGNGYEGENDAVSEGYDDDDDDDSDDDDDDEEDEQEDEDEAVEDDSERQ
jgi:phosphopantothenoylcysteine synthetase/decarboxylase